RREVSENGSRWEPHAGFKERHGGEWTVYRPAAARLKAMLPYLPGVQGFYLRGKGFPCFQGDRSYLCEPFLGYRLNRPTPLPTLHLRSHFQFPRKRILFVCLKSYGTHVLHARDYIIALISIAIRVLIKSALNSIPFRKRIFMGSPFPIAYFLDNDHQYLQAAYSSNTFNDPPIILRLCLCGFLPEATSLIVRHLG
ncbi:hypothetical protein V1478_015862, partial [Vespula squamosa]